MRERNYNIEIMRIIAFVMVIVIHVSNYFCRAYGSVSNGEYVYSLILNVLSRISVPCFFMMSGALLLGRYETIENSLTRAMKFLSVLLIWTGIYYLFNTYYTKQGCDWKLLLEKPAEAHLWYLYVLIPIYVVLPFLQVLCNGMDKRLEKAFIVIGFIWFFIVHMLPYWELDVYFDLPLFSNRSYIYYFFCGYLISKYKGKIRLKNWQLLVIFLGSSLINVIVTTLKTMQEGAHFDRVLAYGSPLIIISAFSFFAFIMKLGEGHVSLSDKAKHWVNICCRCSFGVYLIHIIFLDIYKINVKAAEFSAYYMIPLLVVGITLVSIVAIYLLQKTVVGKILT